MQPDPRHHKEILDDEVIRGSVQTEYDEQLKGNALLKQLAPNEHNSSG